MSFRATSYLCLDNHRRRHTFSTHPVPHHTNPHPFRRAPAVVDYLEHTHLEGAAGRGPGVLGRVPHAS